MYRANQYVPPPGPRSNAWLIALVIAGVIVLVLVTGVVAFFLGGRSARTATQPVASASASAPVPSASVALPAESAPATPMPAPDEPAPPPGTPASSLRARPTWGSRSDIRGNPTQQFAPQLHKPLDVFVQATPMSGELARGFVICRFQSFNKADTFAGDDLHVRARLGTTPEIAEDGPEDGNLAFLSAPLVTLKANDSLSFEVYDRDVFSLVPITRSSTKYTGAPVTLMDTGAAIECRSLSGEPLARMVSTKITAADGELAALTRHRLSAADREWGWPTLLIGGAKLAVTDVAALAGWDDARVRKRVDAIAAAEKSLEEQRAGVFRGLHDPSKNEVKVGSIHATLDELACGGHHGAAGTCVAKMTLRNDGKEPAHVGGFRGTTAYVATAKSGPVTAYLDGKPLAQIEIAPGASVAVTVAPVSKVAGFESEPAIVGLCNENRCGILRAR